MSCGWTEDVDLAAIREYTEKTFPDGVDGNEARAKAEAAIAARSVEAMSNGASPGNPTNKPVAPAPMAVPGIGAWKTLGFEQGNNVNVETQVMQVGGGCIVRTIIDGMEYNGGPGCSASMVFVPGASADDFKVVEAEKQEKR